MRVFCRFRPQAVVTTPQISGRDEEHFYGHVSASFKSTYNEDCERFSGALAHTSSRGTSPAQMSVPGGKEDAII